MLLVLINLYVFIILMLYSAIMIMVSSAWFHIISTMVVTPIPPPTLSVASPPFTALFAATDTMAIGALSALQDSGLRVPEDVFLVGFDGIPQTLFTRPKLTTVEQYPCIKGQVVATAIFDILLNRTAPSFPIITKSSLIIRDSTGPLKRA